MEIAKACGISIHAPERAKITFFNSPYPAHKEKKAVDIYFEGDIALSPIEGKVEKIRRFEISKPIRLFNVMDRDAFDIESEKYEYATIIRSSENPKKVIKIIHMEPYVSEGEKIDIFQEIGRLIVSKFFTFWTGKHIHVEVRNHNDYFRARGGEELEITGKFKGAHVEVGDKIAIIDGGIPYNTYGGILSSAEKGTKVKIGGFNIGRVIRSYKDASIFKCNQFRIRLNKIEYRGISFVLNGKAKLIPKRRCDIEIT